jgi:hypothetical protein
VLEHTADDGNVLRRIYDLLMPNGRVIVFVPAGRELYGSLDRGIGHLRRYDKEDLIQKLTAAGFEIEEIGFQNRISRLAWRANSLFGRSALPAGQSRIFDALVPIFRALEGPRPSNGLSLIAIGRKPAPATSATPVAVDAAGDAS